MSVVKSFLVSPTSEDLDLWSPLTQGSPSERQKLVEKAQKHLAHLLEFKSFVLALNNDPVLEIFPPGTKWNTTYTIPTTNVITLICSSLSILMEGYEADVLVTPLIELSKRTGVEVPQKLHRNTLMDLLSKVPELDLNEKSFLIECSIESHVVFEIINGLLGKSLTDAWRDAFFSLQLDNAIVDSKKSSIRVPFVDLYRFTEVIHSDLQSLPSYPAEDLPYDRSKHYSFGWWINCNGHGKEACLIDALPSDAVFSFGASLSVYVVPSLKMSVVMVSTPETSWNTRTFSEILFAENEVWKQLLMIVNADYHDKVIAEREEKERKQKEEEASGNKDGRFSLFDLPRYIVMDVVLHYFFMYTEFTGRQQYIVRVFLWVMFLVIGHFVVYSGFHGIWKLFTFLSSRTHEPRPKKAAKHD